MVFPDLGMKLIAVFLRYLIMLRNDLTSTSLKACQRLIIYFTISCRNILGLMASLVQLLMVVLLIAFDLILKNLVYIFKVDLLTYGHRFVQLDGTIIASPMRFVPNIEIFHSLYPNPGSMR